MKHVWKYNQSLPHNVVACSRPGCDARRCTQNTVRKGGQHTYRIGDSGEWVRKVPECTGKTKV